MQKLFNQFLNVCNLIKAGGEGPPSEFNENKE